jgi:hypothetical protein
MRLGGLAPRRAEGKKFVTYVSANPVSICWTNRASRCPRNRGRSEECPVDCIYECGRMRLMRLRKPINLPCYGAAAACGVPEVSLDV